MNNITSILPHMEAISDYIRKVSEETRIRLEREKISISSLLNPIKNQLEEIEEGQVIEFPAELMHPQQPPQFYQLPRLRQPSVVLPPIMATLPTPTPVPIPVPVPVPVPVPTPTPPPQLPSPPKAPATCDASMMTEPNIPTSLMKGNRMTDAQLYEHFRGFPMKLFICKYWNDGERCINSKNECRYAHGFDDMVKIHIDMKNKVFMEPYNPGSRYFRIMACPYTKMGMICPYRELKCCNFAHENREIRVYYPINPHVNNSSQNRASMSEPAQAHAPAHYSSLPSMTLPPPLLPPPKRPRENDVGHQGRENDIMKRRREMDDVLSHYQQFMKNESNDS